MARASRSSYLVLLSFITIPSLGAELAANCTSEQKPAVCPDSLVQQQVEHACQLVETKGEDSLGEIDQIRYNCCGEPNYIWINDLSPRMILHPIRSHLNGKKMNDETDPSGFKIFPAFVKAAQAFPKGSWVEYTWPRFGQTQPIPKKSWIRKCRVGRSGEYWVVGSGTWK